MSGKMRADGQVNESVLETERIINFGYNGDDVIREPHLLAGRSDRHWRYLYACIENAIALIIHIPYSAGSQYFPFSTISYELSQYTINRKHPTMYRDTQMELFAFDPGMAQRRKRPLRDDGCAIHT
ncbi:hypothetical protein ALC60_12013 [Trachymyrmex zeteki]|uniref:Uncharacterized protein n=1 Tax=Mycetomoellerius zeteki TaxID=64791 RepID=A0A151WMB4_9HYME|nr:hypothetical protein ALC60_12013 [Trachymyrmex zeteki]